MRIAVMGAGGTGGYFGGLLAQAGEDVIFIARGAHLEAMRSGGLTVKSRLSGNFTVPVKATDNPREIGPVDLVLFCVKAYDTEAAAELILPIVGPETMVISVQNGVDNAERIGRVLPTGKVMAAVAQISSVIEAPGVISHRSLLAKILLGEMDSSVTSSTRRIVDALQSAGMDIELREDILVALWQKFVFICGLSGVTALMRLPLGPIFANAESEEFLRGVLVETDAVGRASGIRLPENCVEATLKFAVDRGPDLYGSMYYDLVSGRRMELETLNGTVVKMGHEHGVSTPYNFSIYAALKPYANGPPDQQ